MDNRTPSPHAHAERYGSSGRWRVILTARDGRQTIVRRNLTKNDADRIAAAFTPAGTP
jgi:hypothetical protein